MKFGVQPWIGCGSNAGCPSAGALAALLRRAALDEGGVRGFGEDDLRLRPLAPEHAPAEGHPAFEPHPIQGWTPNFIPWVLQEAIDDHLFDELIPVSGADGITWAKRLSREEGIFTGVSGGATFAVARQVAERAEEGSHILCMLPDTGERYLSTPRGRDRGHGRGRDRRVDVDPGRADALSRPDQARRVSASQTPPPIRKLPDTRSTSRRRPRDSRPPARPAANA